jgi:magnesium chelatase subunit I
MHAQIGTVKEANLRVKVVDQRTQFDSDPYTFRQSYEESQKELRQKVDAAREVLPKVTISDDLKINVSQICSELDVDGLRGDIVTNRAAMALAAFDDRTVVTPKDIFTVIPLCLRHRLRKDPLESIDSGAKVQEVFAMVFDYK